MEHIEAALAAQNQYLRHYGRPSEEDHSLNDTNRALIEAMNRHYGQKFTIPSTIFVWPNMTLNWTSCCNTGKKSIASTN